MPIHGQYSMLVEHAKIAKSLGMKEERIIVAENGDIVNLSKKKVFVERKKSSFKLCDGRWFGNWRCWRSGFER